MLNSGHKLAFKYVKITKYYWVVAYQTWPAYPIDSKYLSLLYIKCTTQCGRRFTRHIKSILNKIRDIVDTH